MLFVSLQKRDYSGLVCAGRTAESVLKPNILFRPVSVGEFRNIVGGSVADMLGITIGYADVAKDAAGHEPRGCCLHCR